MTAEADGGDARSRRQPRGPGGPGRVVNRRNSGLDTTGPHRGESERRGTWRGGHRPRGEDGAWVSSAIPAPRRLGLGAATELGERGVSAGPSGVRRRSRRVRPWRAQSFRMVALGRPGPTRSTLGGTVRRPTGLGVVASGGACSRPRGGPDLPGPGRERAQLGGGLGSGPRRDSRSTREC